MINWTFRAVSLLLLGVLLFSCSSNDKLELETFKTDTGWGYCVKTNEKLFIKQKYIPAISGYYAFINEDDARKVGRLVLKKLKNKQHPSITIQELDSLKLNFPKENNLN